MIVDHGRQLPSMNDCRAAVQGILTLLILCFILQSPCESASPESSRDRLKRVLIIPSYNFNYLGSQRFLEGVVAEFAEHAPFKTTFLQENLQLAEKSCDQQHMENMAASLKLKYEIEKPDLIFLQYKQALQFMLRYGREIFGDVPVVFSGLTTEGGYGQIELPENYAGITASYSAKKNIELILKNHPKVKKIYVVAGASPVEQDVVKETIKEGNALGREIEFIALTNLTFPALLVQLDGIRGDSVILYELLLVDAEGTVFVPALAAGEIARAAHVPVYGMLDTYMGSGITGGFLIFQEGMGRRAGEIGMDILMGKGMPSASLTTESIASYRFDWRQLRRWGIDENDLPDGSQIEFKEFSVWDSYKWGIIGGICLVVLQAFLIVGLVTNRIRRIKAERVLRQSERRYRAFFEEGPDGVVILNPETGKLIEFNDQVCRQLGYTRDEFARLSLRDIEVSETAEEIQAHIRKVLREGRDDFEAWHRTKQGEIRHVRVTAQVIDAERHSIYHCIWRDITESMRAEDARRLNESRLETLLRLNQMTGTTLHDITEFAMEEAVRLTQSTIGYVAFMNEDETVLTMHAWSRAAMQECRIDDKPLDYPVETTGLWGEAVRQRRPVITNDYQTPNPLKRGTPQGHVAVTRHMNAPVFDGERIVIVAGVGNKPTNYDEADARQLTLLMTGMWHIVQRKRDEEALRASEEKYRQVVENANDAIFIAQDGFIKFPNPRLSVISGYSQEELTQKPFLEFVHPDDRELVATTYQRRLQGEDVPHTYSFRTVDKPGNTVWAELSSVLLDWEGRPASLNFFRDITAEKKLESRLVQAQKMEAVGTLAGGIAHDFNNLLQAVQGYAELLLLPKGKGEPGFRELQEISRAAKRGGELTRQLLAFSRKVESKLQPVDLNRIVEDVRLLLERTIPKMIKMELHLTDNLHPVNADASQIEQILMNLAVNARDAMPDGGTLSVETRNVILNEEVRRSQPELTPGNYVLLAVADTGQGMDKATLKNIFDPFFTTKEVGKGTGLGLAMVYGIIKNHHGHIVCASQPGQGTVFEIYLPAVGKIEKTPAAVTGTHRLRGGNETILLVDDDASLRNLGEQILRFHGYTVTSAQDGEKALQIYKECKGRIDLIVLDLIMPGMGGALCLQRLLEMNPEAKVVIASGYSVSGETEKAAKSGAKAFVQKPYDVQQMIEVVREVLDE